MYRPHLYAKSNMIQRTGVTDLFGRLIQKLRWEKSKEIVLDVGCGTGYITKNILLPHLPKEKSFIIGIDIMPSMIEYAKEYNHDDGIEYKVLDILKLENAELISKEKFTKIFSFYCLNWVQDLELCLKNLYEVLEEGGQAMLLFVTASSTFDMFINMSQRDEWKKYLYDAKNYVSTYSDFNGDIEADFESKALKVGFQIEYCQNLKDFYKFNNTDEAKDVFDSINPFPKRIPSNKQKKFLDECFQYMLNQFPLDSKGEMNFSYKHLDVILSK